MGNTTAAARDSLKQINLFHSNKRTLWENTEGCVDEGAIVGYLELGNIKLHANDKQ
jgi:hypothetical protein